MEERATSCARIYSSGRPSPSYSEGTGHRMRVGIDPARWPRILASAEFVDSQLGSVRRCAPYKFDKEPAQLPMDSDGG